MSKVYSIRELEKLLDSPDKEVDIKPNGEVIVTDYPKQIAELQIKLKQAEAELEKEKTIKINVMVESDNYKNRAFKAIERAEQAEAELEKHRWIPVNEKLPEDDYKYLIFAPSADPDKPFAGIAWYNPKKGWSLLPEAWIEAITHWKPIILPKKGSE